MTTQKTNKERAINYVVAKFNDTLKHTLKRAATEAEKKNLDNIVALMEAKNEDFYTAYVIKQETCLYRIDGDGIVKALMSK